MKKLLLTLLLVLLLTGCRKLYADDYLYVNEHDAPFAYRETESKAEASSAEDQDPETLPKVSRASDIRDEIQNMVLHGEEVGVFLLSDYDGDVKSDMNNMLIALLQDSPKFNYAMDSFDWSLSDAEEGKTVTVTMKLRLTPQEVQAIETVRYSEQAMDKIFAATLQQNSTFIVQISGFPETGIDYQLEDYLLYHPNLIVEEPSVLVSVYPDWGSVRVLDLRVDYKTDRETLRRRRDDTSNYLDIVGSQISYGMGTEEVLGVLYKNLIPRVDYQEDLNATVYTQVVDKRGNSRTMASVVSYLFRLAGLECEVVVGERDGKPWCWNRIMVQGEWRSFDLHTCALAGEGSLELLPSNKMVGYTCDPERYPETDESGFASPSVTEFHGAPSEPKPRKEAGPTEEAP